MKSRASLPIPLVCLTLGAIVACGSGAPETSRADGARRGADDDGVSLGLDGAAAPGNARDASTPADAGASPAGEDAEADDFDSGFSPTDGGSAARDAGTPRRDGGAAVAGGRCLSSEDCLPSEACSQVLLVGGRVEARCGPKNVGGAATGTACAGPASCESNACLADVSGECSIVCEDAARHCPAGFGCTGYAYEGGVTIAFCARACVDDTTCAANQNVCATQLFQRPSGAWAVDSVCQRTLGAGGLGAPCTSGSVCRTGLCISTTRFDVCTADSGCRAGESCTCPGGGAPPCAQGSGSCSAMMCSGLCDADADCAAPDQPLTRCDGVSLALPDGAPTSVRACGPR